MNERHQRLACTMASTCAARSAHSRPPAGDGFIWIADEASSVRELRTHFVEAHHHPGAWIKAAACWHQDENGSGVSPPSPGATHG
jgi:NADPH-dependent ferric siderophore reductase